MLKPTIGFNGSPEHRAERAFVRQVVLELREHLVRVAQKDGKTGDELVALWNEAHPDNPVG